MIRRELTMFFWLTAKIILASFNSTFFSVLFILRFQHFLMSVFAYIPQWIITSIIVIGHWSLISEYVPLWAAITAQPSKIY